MMWIDEMDTPPHDHVLLPHTEDGDGWFQCQVCDFGLFNFEMPDVMTGNAWKADRERVQREAGFFTRRSGKRAAYDEAIRYATAQYGPGQPLIGRDGKVHGQQFFARQGR